MCITETTPWPESESELHRPIGRRLSAKLVPTFADTGWHVVSLADLYGRILGFLDRDVNYSVCITWNWPPLWSSGQSSWLQNQRPGFDSRGYQIFWEVVGLERGPLSLVSTIEELLDRKGSGGCSVGIVRSRTQAMELSFSITWNYTPTTLGVQSWREIISGGTEQKNAEYPWSMAWIVSGHKVLAAVAYSTGRWIWQSPRHLSRLSWKALFRKCLEADMSFDCWMLRPDYLVLAEQSLSVYNIIFR
jgi:hypothetical protein